MLLGTRSRVKECPEIREILEKKLLESFQDTRDELRSEAKKNIAKMQQENKRALIKEGRRPRIIARES